MHKKDFPYLHMFIACCCLTIFWLATLWETEKTLWRRPEALGALFSAWAFVAGYVFCFEAASAAIKRPA